MMNHVSMKRMGEAGKIPSAISQYGLRVANGLLDVILPPRCSRCGDRVAQNGSICGQCWPSLRFVSAPLCQSCGLPFDFDPGANVLCAACIAEPLPVSRMRAALAYDDGSKPLLLSFKHGDRLDLAPLLTRWMAGAGSALLEEADLVVPVPLHWRRLLRRRYNQAAILALGLGRGASIPVDMSVLLRRKPTKSQGNMSRSARLRNVAGAFTLGKHAEGKIADKRILLIDDVLTTGATLHECARLLLRHGARTVDGLAIARVIRPAIL